MQTRNRDLFTTIHVEGAILRRTCSSASSPAIRTEGLTPESYHLIEGEKINEVTSRSWNRLLGAWAAFQEHLARLPENDAAPPSPARNGCSTSSESWAMAVSPPLKRSNSVTKLSVSHTWQTTPIHLVGCV